MFMKEMLQEFTFPVVGTTILLQRFKRALELILDEGVPSSALFWLLFMGGLAAKEGVERKWFVVQLARMGRRLEVERWDDARRVLGRMIWVGKILDGTGRGLWGEVEGVMNVTI